MAKPKRRMVKVPLRLEGESWRAMTELSRLTGYSVSTVASVLVAVGYLKELAIVGAGLNAKAAQSKTTKRGKRG